jgi:Nitrate reductase gamma subunit
MCRFLRSSDEGAFGYGSGVSAPLPSAHVRGDSLRSVPSSVPSSGPSHSGGGREGSIRVSPHSRAISKFSHKNSDAEIVIAGVPGAVAGSRPVARWAGGRIPSPLGSPGGASRLEGRFAGAVGVNDDAYHWISVTAGWIAGAAVVAGFSIVVYRRLRVLRVRATTTRSDSSCTRCSQRRSFSECSRRSGVLRSTSTFTARQ